MSHCRAAWAAFALLASAYSVSATSLRPMLFEHLTYADGLSQSTVNDLMQDSQGFVWLATESGLNRFDGYGVQRYLKDFDDPGSLSGDYVWQLAESPDGNLWLATASAGLVCWERARDRFKSISARGVIGRAVAVAPDGNIWLGTRGQGVHVHDAKGSLLRTLNPSAASAAERLPADTVSVFAVAPDGRIWAGTTTGLAVFSPNGGWRMLRHDPADQDSLSDDDILSLHADQDGTIWAGTYEHGLNRISPDGARVQRFRSTGTDGSLPSDQIRDIVRDDQGRLWVGTQAGLAWFDESEGRFHTVPPDPRRRLGLRDPYVMSMTVDDGGLLWVGTRSAGASRWNPRTWRLGRVTPGWLEGAHISSFAAAPGAGIWVGTIARGLLSVDDDGTLRDEPTRLPTLPDERVMSMLRDSRGRYWIGTMTGGLSRFDPRTAELETFRHDPGNPQSIAANGIMSIAEDPSGAIWVGTFGGGVSRINADGSVSQFPHLPDDPSSLGSPRATAFAFGQDGEVWVGTDGGGLNLIEPFNDRVRQFRHDPDNPRSLRDDTIFSLLVDTAGTLWIGTANAGLARISRGALGEQQPTIAALGSAAGLSSSAIYGIIEAREGELWISGNRGLMVLDIPTRSVREFREHNGLQADEFNFGAHLRLPDGRLLFGGASGFNLIDPTLPIGNEHPPNIVLTGLEINDLPARLDKPAFDLDHLVLDHNDRVVSFEFAALDFAASGENRYRTFLEGFDTDWSAPTVRRRRTYTNLDSGSYTFHVMGANDYGVWSGDPLSVAVEVRAAPWLTVWAWLSYAAIAGLTIWLFLRWQLARMRLRVRQEQLSFYDPLTGLPDRELFLQRAELELNEARQDGRALSIIALEVGVPPRSIVSPEHMEQALRTLVPHLLHSAHGLDASDAVEFARADTQAFAALVRGIDAERNGMKLARDLLHAATQTVDVGGTRQRLTARAGVANFPTHASSAGDLLTLARAAASARRPGDDDTAAPAMHGEVMTERTANALRRERGLRSALDGDAIGCLYEPIFDSAGELAGAQAWPCWSADGETVSGQELIRLSEEAGVRAALDAQQLRAVARRLGRWRAEGLLTVPVYVRIAGASLHEADVQEALANTLSASGADATQLGIELDASEATLNSDGRMQRLQSLRERGHPVSLAEVGTGNLSASRLLTLGATRYLIAGEFIERVDKRAELQAVCRAVVTLSRGLGVSCGASGVGSALQLEFLRQLGLDQFQGGYLGEPESEDEFRYRMPST